MAAIVEIENSKIEDLSEYLEKVLKYSGRAMSCLQHLMEEMEEMKEEEPYKKSKYKKSVRDKDDDEYLRYY